MRLLPCVLITLCCACSTEAEPGSEEALDSRQEARTWEWWREAFLTGEPTAALPPIPAEGWTQRQGRSWFRRGAELADHDSDGRLDYIRIVVPPGSYNHRVWKDDDHDGYFDHEAHLHEADWVNERFPVPDFEPANRLGPEALDSTPR